MVKGPTYSGVLPFTVSAAIPRNFPIGTQREMHFVPRIAAQSAHVFSDPTFFPRRWSEKTAVAGHLGNNVACMLALEMVSNKMTTQQLTPFELGQVKAQWKLEWLQSAPLKKSGVFDWAFFFKFLLPLLILSVVRIIKRQRGVRDRVLPFTASND